MQLTDIIEKLSTARVLVIGDVMLDRYVYGRVERVSYEAPIPVLAISRDEQMPGGAGNAARNAAALGAKTKLVGLIGADPAGAELQAAIRAAGIEPILVIDRTRPTTVKTRYIAAGQQLLRADQELIQVAGERAGEILQAFERALPDSDAVILSDYAKGVLCDEVLEAVIARAKAAGKIVIADPKSRNFARYRGVDLLKPNRQELAAATGMVLDSDAAIIAAARAELNKSGIGAMLVSRSEEGMTLVEKNGGVLHLPAEAREVFDVSGAGDTTVATLATALATGAALSDAAKLASIAAAIVVGKVGTAVVSRSDLSEGYDRVLRRSSDQKILPVEQAAEQVRRWHAEGRVVGFANGCFDLVHPGHISLLSQARSACDRLIVAINTDASVTRLKGPTRPVQPEAARAAVLAAFELVDLVVSFSEDTPYEIVKALKPDILVKGADYRIEQVVGADLVQSWGGRVVLADLTPGFSTSKTIAKISQ